jgi:hypothetical protein
MSATHSFGDIIDKTLGACFIGALPMPGPPLSSQAEQT